MLIIEDHVETGESLRLFLTFEGFFARAVTTGIDGLDEARRIHPRAIICDLSLPGSLDGCDVAALLRRDRAFANALLIAVTGSTRFTDRLEAEQAGFDVVLPKPVNHSDLVSMLREAIQN